MNRTIISIGGAIALATVTGLGLAGCTITLDAGKDSGATTAPVVSETALDRNKVQQDVAEGILDQIGVAAVVDCPADMSGVVGDTWTCNATDGTYNADVLITLTGEDGSYTWDLLGSSSSDVFEYDTSILAQDIADNLANDFGLDMYVVCPEVMTGPVGTEWTCQAEDGDGDTSDVIITLTALDGSYTYSAVDWQ